MITQLTTPIPLQTPKGKAWAVALIDYGPQWDLQWITFIHATGECWTFQNSQIRQEQNFTFNLPYPTAISNHTSTQPMRPQREEKIPIDAHLPDLEAHAGNGHM